MPFPQSGSEMGSGKEQRENWRTQCPGWSQLQSLEEQDGFINEKWVKGGRTGTYPAAGEHRLVDSPLPHGSSKKKQKTPVQKWWNVLQNHLPVPRWGPWGWADRSGGGAETEPFMFFFLSSQLDFSPLPAALMWIPSPALPGGLLVISNSEGPQPSASNPDHDQPHGIISPGINRLQTISGCTSILEMPPRCLPNYCNLQSCLSICPSILLLPAPLNPSFCPVQSLRGNGTGVIQNSG